jgi:1-acyl-sn-glycerol-3-phosphate acyltransferase
MPEGGASRLPDLPAAIPRRRSWGRRTFGRLILRAMGWRVEGTLPDLRKFVIIVAPHTSNWDFVVGFAVYLAIEIEASWLGKHTLFRWPLGPILRYFGGIPVVRTQATNVVQLHVEEFQRREQLVVVVAPEGTRKRTSDWKSGFYRMAQGAGVPIAPVALDFPHRLVRFLPLFEPTGDYAVDLPRLKANYHAGMAKIPAGY